MKLKVGVTYIQYMFIVLVLNIICTYIILTRF